jgi:hypothetical protein
MGEAVTFYDMPESVRTFRFEFLYVDGPTNTLTEAATGYIRDPHETLPNVDAMWWSDTANIMLIDQRRATLAYFADSLSDDWVIATDIASGFSKRRIYHSVLMRKTYFSCNKHIKNIVRGK